MPSRPATATFSPHPQNPYASAPPGPQTYSPAPRTSTEGPPGGTYPPGMAPTSYKMPDIPKFKGDADQDYER